MKLRVVVLVVVFLFCCPASARAESFTEALTRESGVEELEAALEEDTLRFTEQAEDDGILTVLSQLLQEKLHAPLRSLAGMVAVLVLCKLSACFGEETVSSVVSVCGALGCTVLVVSPLFALLQAVQHVAEAVSVFLLAAVPVYGGLLVASGSPGAGSTYSTLTLLFANAVPFLCSSVLLPALRVFFALAMLSAFSSLKLSALADSLYAFLKWALVLSVAVFSGTLSVQTLLNAQVDAAASKAVKLMSSTAVPIVGGAIGDAAAAIYNSVNVVKSGAGAFGILAVLCMFLPTAVEVTLWSMVCAVVRVSADLLELPRLSSFLKLCGGAAKMILAILCAMCAVSVASAALVLVVKGGAA